ncbi:MAG: tRNA (N6-isopentenyl adenosine(37)-C2)-methylthiotransferase MiaB [Bacilli bacterium]|nr:tRNA (N6-isopentenyl adenosine(37)-C2)-methylthiotransferase MiaB [Bacilli bacterium]
MKTKIINTPDLLKAASRKKEVTNFCVANAKHLKDLKPLAKGKKYYIRTYGCQANVRDEETMRAMLEDVGYSFSKEVENVDVIIINTCAVRENAEDKVYGEIGNLKRLRKKNKNLILAICGCMVEQPEILKRLMDTFPEVNLFFGTHEIAQLLDLIYDCYSSNERIVAIESKQGEVVEFIPDCRNNHYKAYVNIIYGCNKFCTYCIVPYTRGKERSRHFNDVIKECQRLIDAGYQEITLLGQNVNAYGKDLDEGKDFADLLEAVAKLGIPRLRFTTSHPWDFSSKMIDVIAKYPNIMKFIHLPVQSGNDEILRKMGRRYTREQYLNLVKEMREKIPGLSLSTDIIVGFPNENEEQFQDTCSLVDIVQYEAAFTFIYSPRKGTPAAKMEDNVSKETKTRRFQELVKHLEKHIEEYSNAMVGNTYDVLVDGVSKTDENMLSGYTETNKLVHFKGDLSLVGTIVKVKIKESHTYSLIGELVNG